MWSNVIKCDQVWSSVIKFDQMQSKDKDWSRLINEVIKCAQDTKWLIDQALSSD